MVHKNRTLVHGAFLAALYVVLTHAQNLLIPDSATWAIQFRISEALCVFAFFTPGAIGGLALGCFFFNLTSGAALPLDFLIGSLASLLSALTMWLTRHWTIRRYPLFGMFMPALFNALLVGWELSVYVGGGFFINALLVFLGEAAVLLTLGSTVYWAIVSRHLDTRLFPESSRR